MKWIIHCKQDDEAVFVNLDPQVLSHFPEYIKLGSTIFQKKQEFHITLFWWEQFFSSKLTDSEPWYIKNKIGQILDWYSWEEISDIELKKDMFHIQKGEKHSLISTIESPQIEGLIQKIIADIGIVIWKDTQPFLHATVYTNLEFPRGVWIPTIREFHQYNLWQV